VIAGAVLLGNPSADGRQGGHEQRYTNDSR
jgi:hypothetical protein